MFRIRINSSEWDGNLNGDEMGENHYIHLILLPRSFEEFRGIPARYSLCDANWYKYGNFQRIAVAKNKDTSAKFYKDFSATIGTNLAYNLVFYLVNKWRIPQDGESRSKFVQLEGLGYIRYPLQWS